MKRSTKLFHCTEAVSLDKNYATNSENIQGPYLNWHLLVFRTKMSSIQISLP